MQAGRHSGKLRSAAEICAIGFVRWRAVTTRTPLKRAATLTKRRSIGSLAVTPEAWE
jgi:hypothetical protein